MNLLNGSRLTLYGAVGDVGGIGDFFTAKAVREALDQHGPGDIVVHLNSGGGIALEGLAIFNTLRAHQGNVTVIIDAIAASAASLIAMAGDERVMREGAVIMIHHPRAAQAGTADEHRKCAAKLDTLADQFRRIYAVRSGRGEKEIGDMMSAETWMDADDAISLGFATSKINEQSGQATAFDYSLYQNTPADLAEQTGNILMTTKVPTITDDETIEKPKPWAARFYASAGDSGLSVAELTEIVMTSDTRDAAKDALVSKMATTRNVNLPKFGGGRRELDDTSLSGPHGFAKAAGDAIYARMSGTQPEGAAREVMGMSLLDMGSRMLHMSGERISWASRHDVADRVLMAGGHSTSDFPNLLTSAARRVLQTSYESAGSPLKQLARRIDAPDFRALTSVRLSGAPSLDPVNEGAEIGYGTRFETKESFKVGTYGKIFCLTREALINDDLGAFAKSNVDFGRAAARCEADIIASLFTANSGNGIAMDDGSPIYGTARGNKAASGSAITVDALGAARRALREMKDVDGKTLINAVPKYLVVGPAKETEAEKALASLLATQLDDVNPFSGKYTLYVEPRFAGNAWRLFADPADISTIAIAYLNGHNGPSVTTREGWTTLGLEVRAVLDFGAGIENAKGTYLNPGDVPEA
jgi:ATP-dependent protease ClpP protease subunit